jgi:hypothetical protein
VFLRDPDGTGVFLIVQWGDELAMKRTENAGPPIETGYAY